MAAGLFGLVLRLSAGRSQQPAPGPAGQGQLLRISDTHGLRHGIPPVWLDLGIMPALIAVPLESAAVLALSLAGWWLLSKIPIVKERLI